MVGTLARRGNGSQKWATLKLRRATERNCPLLFTTTPATRALGKLVLFQCSSSHNSPQLSLPQPTNQPLPTLPQPTPSPILPVLLLNACYFPTWNATVFQTLHPALVTGKDFLCLSSFQTAQIESILHSRRTSLLQGSIFRAEVCAICLVRCAILCDFGAP